MRFVAAVKGDVMRLRMAMHVHRGMKRVERRNREAFCRMWRMVGDWPLSGIVNVQANDFVTRIYCSIDVLLQLHLMCLC